MLEKLLESLDESVFTESVRQDIRESFDEAVNLKATALVEERMDELEYKSAEHLEHLNEKSEEHLEYLSKKAEEYTEFLEEKAEEYVELKTAKLQENVEAYLDYVVEEIVQEIQESLTQEVESLEAQSIREAFETMLAVAGAEMQKSILESADEEIRSEIETVKGRYNQAIDELLALKEENEKLLKLGVIQEMSEGLTLVEAERFARLADTVPFTRDQKFLDRLESIREGMKSVSKSGVSDIVPAPQKSIFESRDTKEVKGSLFSFDHLL